MKSSLFQKLNKNGFDKVTKNLVEFINRNKKLLLMMFIYL